MAEYCNWLEWDEMHHSLHRNVPGRAIETLLGRVLFIHEGKSRAEDDKKAWSATRADGTEVGRYETRGAAKAALVKACGVQEME